MKDSFECIIIGGGIAGLQAAIQLGRYQRKVLVIDSNNGRSTICKGYHNILGWPNGISGEKLRELGRQHAEKYNVTFLEDKVITAIKDNRFYILTTEKEKSYKTKTILLATGITDRIPNIKNLKRCLGLSIYVCPDCDGYEVANKSVLVLGSGEAGANLALALTYWTETITYVNHDGQKIENSLRNILYESNIGYREEKIGEVITEGASIFKGIKLQNGDTLYAERAFIGFGGNEVHTELAKQLGVNLLKNKHVIVDSRTKETNISGIWAAGDIVAHSQQVTIAMGDGAQAAVWIHKRLLQG